MLRLANPRPAPFLPPPLVSLGFSLLHPRGPLRTSATPDCWRDHAASRYRRDGHVRCSSKIWSKWATLTRFPRGRP